ncbi:hypothetical protein OAN307_c39310 [Octadecabacter antarcticus 307]|uniref:Uncharacterized protein n=1 Tax=Octadecabacter antarcticus 307 TaxID=391626 RepID=M9RG24_9RHOB|nr:hypothetical protein OAN307_c39310 [Octadecabacter antarcticus 307]
MLLRAKPNASPWKLRHSKMKPLSIPLALLMLTFFAGCGQTDIDRAQRASESVGVVAAERNLADLPSDCRRTSSSGVAQGTGWTLRL